MVKRETSLSIIHLETGDEVSTVSGAALMLDGQCIHTFEENEPLNYEFNLIKLENIRSALLGLKV